MRRGFAYFVAAQAFGAFNDNAFKTFVALSATATLPPAEATRLVGIAGALFIAPFLLFSTVAGWVADRYGKRDLIVGLKVIEVVLLAAAVGCLHRLHALLGILFLMGVHSAFFSPVKLAIVPELVEDRDLSRANGMVQMTTFVAIILGTAAAGWLADHPSRAQVLLLASGVVGFIPSLFIAKTPVADAKAPLRLNPLPLLKEVHAQEPVWLATVGASYFWFVAALLQMALVAAARGSAAAHLQIVVALAIGVGSFLAGRVSRDQVELGLVPLGAFGIVVGAFMPFSTASLVLLGMAAGFYVLPLQAFIQQRAPAETRGSVMAAVNFLSFAAVLAASGFYSLLKPGIAFPVVGCMTAVVAGYLTWMLPDFLGRLLMLAPGNLLYRIRVEGLENVPATGAALLVSNHVSFIDAFLIGLANRRLVRFLMFRAYYDLPVVGWFFKAMKCIPISDRDGAKALIKSFQDAQQELKNGALVCIFAEGEISRHGQMLRFKKGFERIVGGLDVPVIPVHLDQVWGSVFSFSGGRTLFKWPRRIPYPVTVTFGKPLPKDADAFACRQAIVELSAEAFRHRLEGHARTLGRAFVSSALRHPFRRAVSDSLGKSWTYIGLLARALFVKLEGQRVGILLPPSCGAVLLNVACQLQGKTAINLNYTLGKDQLDACAAKCDVVYSKDRLPGWGWGGIGKTEVASVMFTSGSTGVPKGVMLTHENILSNVLAISQVYELRPSDRILGILPFFHSFGFTASLWMPLLSGMSASYHYNPLDAKRVGEIGKDCTMMLATPTFLQFYIRKIPSLPRLRLCVTGAERLREETAKAFEEKFGVRPLEGYGCTELSPVAAVNIRDIDWPGYKQTGAKPGSVGQPLPGVYMKVVDPDTGQPKAMGEPGLLLVKGPNVMKGYLDDPQKTAEVMRDGFYVTGDIAAIDADGFVTLTDRLSRFSKIGGEMVPHVKVEEALHEAIGATEQSFVVVAGPDERLIVFYKKGTDVSKKPAGIPNLWVPDRRDYREIEEFPLLGTGKLDLKKLKDLACSSTTTST